MEKFSWRQSVVAVAFLLSLSVAIFFVVRAAVAGDGTGTVPQCHEWDRGLFLAAIYFLGRARRSTPGGFVRDAGLHLQRPRAIHRRDTWQSRLGHSWSYWGSDIWLEVSEIHASHSLSHELTLTILRQHHSLLVINPQTHSRLHKLLLMSIACLLCYALPQTACAVDLFH